MNNVLIKLQSVRADMNAHTDVIRSMEEMGAQLTRRVEDVKEREDLKERLSHIDIRWRHLVGLADAIRCLIWYSLQKRVICPNIVPFF